MVLGEIFVNDQTRKLTARSFPDIATPVRKKPTFQDGRSVSPLFFSITATLHSLPANYVLLVKEKNRLFHDRIPNVIHKRPYERKRCAKFGQVHGIGIGELITIVTHDT